MNHPAPIIALEDVTLSYNNEKQVFTGLSLSFRKGEFYLVKGRSGAGKTSLLRLICRLEEPCTGKLFFYEKSYEQYAPPFLRKKIIYLHQTPMAMEGSIRDNILFPFSYKISKDDPVPDDETLLSYLDMFLLNGLSLDEKANRLSVGQVQRVCFIRGLILNPEVILLDEPTSALDDESAEIVTENVEKFCIENKKTIIMISHKPFLPKNVTPKTLYLDNSGIREIQ